MLTPERITQLQEALNNQGFFITHEPNGEWTIETEQAYMAWCMRNNVPSELHRLQPEAEEQIPEGLRDPELLAAAAAEAAERQAKAAAAAEAAAAAADDEAKRLAEEQAAAEAEAQRLAAEAEAQRLAALQAAEGTGDEPEDKVIETPEGDDEEGDDEGDEGDEPEAGDA